MVDTLAHNAGGGPAVPPRRVIRWLQSLQLSVPVGRVLRKELSNGYVVAEILQRHRVPEGMQELYLPSFENGERLETKLSNWSRLKEIFEAQGFAAPDNVIDATIHCKRGAAEHFLLLLHAHLTSVKVSDLPENPEFSDAAYQSSLPYYARNTTATLIKANTRPLELKTQPDVQVQTGNITRLVGGYRERDREDRAGNPARYGRKPLNEKGIPTPAAPVTPARPDTTMMRKSSQFVKTSRQRTADSGPLSSSLVPVPPSSLEQRSSSAGSSRRSSGRVVVGPIGHTGGLSATKRLDEGGVE